MTARESDSPIVRAWQFVSQAGSSPAQLEATG
jgi:hypothetical protein